MKAFSINIIGLSNKLHHFEYEFGDEFFRFYESNLAPAGSFRADIDLNKLLIQEPLLQQAMYHDPRGDFFQKLQAIDKSKCNAVSQMYSDLLEYYAMLEKSLKTADKDSEEMAYCWEQYIKYLWTNSFAFRRYIVLTKVTWTPRFLAKFPKEEFHRLENDLKSR